jgi:hypothetical protein
MSDDAYAWSQGSTWEMAMNSAALVVFLVFLAYAVLGSVGLGLWQRHTRGSRPVNVHVDPDAYLAYWLPLTVAGELFALIGAGGMVFLLTVTSPLLSSPDGAIYRLGFIIGLAVGAVLFAALDIVVIILARRVARQQADAQAHDAPPHS